MAQDKKNKNCNCDCQHEHDSENEHEHEIEVVELEDENGEKEEFAILDELDFEGRHFCIMAPLAEVQAFSEADHAGTEEGEEGEDDEPNLSIEIFEVKDDDFTILEDEGLAKRLLAHLDEISAELEEEEGK